jgi:hypothetical protein
MISSVECPFCFEEIDASLVSEETKESQQITGLRLVYQINQQRIDVPASGRTVLGREAFGANVLSNIFFNGRQVISRQHCSVEFRENRFYVQDEGSLNGTFYGPNKINCRNLPQPIQNGNLIYLGQEPFLATIQKKPVEKWVQTERETPQAATTITKYRCNDPNCTPPYECELIPPDKVCPKCGTFDRFVAVTWQG